MREGSHVRNRSDTIRSLPTIASEDPRASRPRQKKEGPPGPRLQQPWQHLVLGPTPFSENWEINKHSLYLNQYRDHVNKPLTNQRSFSRLAGARNTATLEAGPVESANLSCTTTSPRVLQTNTYTTLFYPRLCPPQRQSPLRPWNIFP